MFDVDVQSKGGYQFICAKYETPPEEARQRSH
jgi:hypothetical protein